MSVCVRSASLCWYPFDFAQCYFACVWPFRRSGHTSVWNANVKTSYDFSEVVVFSLRLFVCFVVIGLFFFAFDTLNKLSRVDDTDCLHAFSFEFSCREQHKKCFSSCNNFHENMNGSHVKGRAKQPVWKFFSSRDLFSFSCCYFFLLLLGSFARVTVVGCCASERQIWIECGAICANDTEWNLFHRSKTHTHTEREKYHKETLIHCVSTHARYLHAHTHTHSRYINISTTSEWCDVYTMKNVYSAQQAHKHRQNIFRAMAQIGYVHVEKCLAHVIRTNFMDKKLFHRIVSLCRSLACSRSW